MAKPGRVHSPKIIFDEIFLIEILASTAAIKSKMPAANSISYDSRFLLSKLSHLKKGKEKNIFMEIFCFVPLEN